MKDQQTLKYFQATDRPFVTTHSFITSHTNLLFVTIDTFVISHTNLFIVQ